MKIEDIEYKKMFRTYKQVELNLLDHRKKKCKEQGIQFIWSDMRIWQEFGIEESSLGSYVQFNIVNDRSKLERFLRKNRPES